MRRLQASIAALVVALLVSPCASAAVSVEVAVRRCGSFGADAADQPLQLRVTRPGRLDTSEDVVKLVQAGSLATVELEEGEHRLLVVEAPDVWSEAAEVAVGKTPVQLELRVWPRTRLTGRIQVPRGEGPPREIEVRLRPVRDRAGDSRCAPRELTTRCAVDRSARLDCGLPSGEWNLRFRAEGLAARHLWSMTLRGGYDLDVGRIELRHGGTVFGEVTTIDGPADPRITRVTLEPVIAEQDTDPRLRAEAEELRWTAKIDAQGYFLFEGVPPGLYRVAADQPGFSPVSRYPVEIVEGRETTLLAPLLLAPPVVLRIEVRPRAAAGGDPWDLVVMRHAPTGDELQVVARGEADAETGIWRTPALPVGEYRVEARTADGGVLATSDVVVEEGDRDVRSVVLDLDLVEVAGELSVGDEPVAALLWFGGRSGSVRVRARSDGEGRFRTILPEGGEWRVDVEADEPPIVAQEVPVDVGDGTDDLRIRLPATRIRGEVLDAEGVPAPAALVRLLGESGDQGAIVTILRSGTEGRFEALGLAEGTYWVEAERAGRTSERTRVELSERVESPWLRLTLRDRVTVRGLVVSEAGGVRGALVVAVPLFPGGGLSIAESALTDAAGEVELEIPPEVDRLLLFVLPPGFGVTIAESGRGEFVVPVNSADGEVRLRVAEQPADGLLPLLGLNGRFVDLGLLARWASMHGVESVGDDMRLPAMPRGSYAYCLVAPEEAPLVAVGRALPTRCSTGSLAAGGVLVLERPQ